MTDNETATALSGATTSAEVRGSAEAAPATSGPDLPEEFREFNTALRYGFLECNRRIQVARAAGDAASERRALSDRENIAAQFVAKNTRLAQVAAQPVMMKDRDLSAEHLQAALLGLWEAFVGTDPAAVDGVIVDDAGHLHPTGGWDPEKGTFATYAGTFMSGRARRSVRTAEGAFTGMSYHTWGQKPAVDRATRELHEELGVVPTVAQIAERAGVTEETVRACSKAAPASLDALVSGDGSATLGDMIAEQEVSTDHRPLDADAAEAELSRLAVNVATVDLLVLLLRTGLSGSPPRSVVQTADKLGLGRGSVAPAMARAERAFAGV